MTELEIHPQEVKRLLDSGEAVRMLDVREPFEHEQASIRSAQLIPMREVPQSLDKLRAGDGLLVVFCHHGIRSLQVVEWLRRQGVDRCASMAGGIDRWSLEMDPAVPRYF